MHDLGKIAVDDAILRKPGRFTPEEFAEMKKHAPEGARLVKQILDGTDNVEFMNIAVNVAHYHHERMDGSGYPDKLVGEQIPLEARIMAIVDVYDKYTIKEEQTSAVFKFFGYLFLILIVLAILFFVLDAFRYLVLIDFPE